MGRWVACSAVHPVMEFGMGRAGVSCRSSYNGVQEGRMVGLAAPPFILKRPPIPFILKRPPIPFILNSVEG